jgi:hypothetical protein
MGRRPKDYVADSQEVADVDVYPDVDVQESEVVTTEKSSVVKICDSEWERRTKLDVSNPDYINPSYDR